MDEVFEELTIGSLPCSNDYSSTFVQAISMTRPLCAPAIRPNIYNYFYLLNVFLHNRRQSSVELLINNGILRSMFQSASWQQNNCKGHCDSMLGSLSSLVELVEMFIVLLSEDNTQNKLGITQVFHFGMC